MKVVPPDKADLTLPDVAEMAKNGPVILTRRGKPLAAVKDLSGFDWEAVSLANNPRFVALIEEARRSYQEEGGIGLDDLRKELGLRAQRPVRNRKKKG
jgi:hypothetical protein